MLVFLLVSQGGALKKDAPQKGKLVEEGAAALLIPCICFRPFLGFPSS